MASAYEIKLFTEATVTDQDAAKYFGIAIGGLIATFIVSHWTQKLSFVLFPKTSAIRRIGDSLTRPIRRVATSTIIGGFLVLPGRIILALAYFGINFTLTFTDVNWSQETLFAKRLGWMALCNLCLVIFLGLKNTPLSPLAGCSYDSVNVLHRCCGYTTVVYVVLHSAIYVAGLTRYDALYVMIDPHQYAAAVAGVSMIMIAITAFGFVRKRQYEVFYVVHVILVAVILVTGGIHVYDPTGYVSPRTIIIIAIAAGLWVLDRILRLTRWIYYSVGNYCTLTPLPEGATRVTIRRSIKAKAGSHVYLYIPGVRALQNHPFTLLATQPAEFVVAARDGFTKALYEAACRSDPKTRFRAAIEGPYGRVPDVRNFDKVILLAGGSGATFTLALALDWARNLRSRKHRSTLDFVWTTRTRAYMHWFDAELAELRANPAVKVSIHITGMPVDVGPLSEPNSSLDLTEKDKPQAKVSTTTRSSKASSRSSILRRGRPDVDLVIEDAVARLSDKKSVLVAGCGPDGMLTDIRVAASALMKAGAPGIDVHLEAFEW